MERVDKISYVKPGVSVFSYQAEAVLCQSTGTEPFDDNGNYNWGV